jgi:transporter family protein
METWLLYALLSIVFAGITTILAKIGIQSIHPDLGLGIRTSVIFLLIIIFNLVGAKWKEIQLITHKQLLLLIGSGITTTLSWVYYYRAIKEGPVSYIAAIDKGSIIITLALSFFLLKEPLSAKVLIGAAFIFVGMLILVWK